MFIARDFELRQLEKLYGSGRFEMAVIYGRRRVGKTTLISQFCSDKRCLFFTGLESNAEANLVSFSDALNRFQKKGSQSVHRNFDAILTEVGELAQDQRMVLVIDEYPWLAGAESSFSSLLQAKIDHRYGSGKLFLILCGSSMSFMQEKVLGEKSPLFGRRTAQFCLQPLNYFETSLFNPSWTQEESALVYGVTGGIPLYASRFQGAAGKELDEALTENYFTPGGFLYDEPSSLIKQELREPRLYNAIIAAIARGASRLVEIAGSAKIPQAQCARYLETLQELMIVTREVPVTEKETSRKTIYSVDDLMFRFWYRFVQENISAIETRRGELVYEKRVKPFLAEYMGKVFERMCRQYLLFRASALPLDLLKLGRWWGSDPETKQQEEIDLLGLSLEGHITLFGECKYKNTPIGLEELDRLRRRSLLLHGVERRFYALFSKRGFTEKLLQRACSEEILLISLQDMYKTGEKG